MEKLLDEEKYVKRLDEIVKKQGNIFVVDFMDLENREELRTNYKETMKGVFGDINDIVNRKVGIHARKLGVDECPTVILAFANTNNKKSMRELSSDDINSLMEINGIVTSTISPRSIVVRAIYLCSQCGESLVIDQESDDLTKPTKCPSCNSRKGFTLKETESVWDDYQETFIQENPEEVTSGVVPRTMKMRMVGKPLMDICKPGDVVNVVCTMLPEPMRTRGLGRVFNWYLGVNNVEVLNADAFSTELSEEDMNDIFHWASLPKIRDIIIRSIYPSIFGNATEKYAITLSLFGGTDIKKSDIEHRGTINILLLGDPSTAKTRMLLAAHRIAPKGIYTDGTGATGVGLAAAVIKGEHGWRIEAGPLVLADRGNCFIDELEKMDDGDRKKIHGAMSIQQIRLDKANQHATLNARTAIIAAANPAHGRYDPYQTLAENVSLPATILSRFDLILIMKDVPSEERDRKLMEKILRVQEDDENKDLPRMSGEMIKKYILYAKTIEPKLNDEAVNTIVDFYVQMRSLSTRDLENPIAITARQGEGVRRLAEASARMALKSEADKEDAEIAIKLMMEMLERAGYDPDTGKIDILNIESGKTKSKEDKQNLILRELSRHGGEPLHIDELADNLANYMDRDELRRRMAGMNTYIFSPRPDFWKRI